MILSSKQFYKKFGVEKLSKRVNENRTRKYLQKIIPYFKKDDKILDLACGYGRITIPLAKKNYDISGLDISPNLLNYARREAKKQKLKINFKEGDMRRLPYRGNSFDKIICLWSSFNEITSPKDQLKIINEIYRVLRPKGLAFIDLFNGEAAYSAFWRNKKMEKGRTYIVELDKLKIKHYVHTRKTLKNLAKRSKFKKYEASFKNIGRRRIVLILRK